MTKFELLKETLRGNLEENVPISLWKHHPVDDRSPKGLAAAEISFHKAFNHDLLKISFHGRYPVVDWGCTAVYNGALSGSTTCESCAVSGVGDWESLEPLDVNTGEFGHQVQAVRFIHEYAQDKVPIMATIFDAPMVAEKLCENQLIDYITNHPEVMKHVLALITDVMVDFGTATLDAGADGLFIASQHSTKAAVTDQQYREFILPFDIELVSRLSGRTDFIAFHLHAREDNEEIRFRDIATNKDVKAVNWEDQSSIPSLKEGKRISKKCVMGAIDHSGVFRKGTPDEAVSQVLDTLQESGLRRVIVAPGCVISVDTPIENIQAVVNAVRSINPYSKEWADYT